MSRYPAGCTDADIDRQFDPPMTHCTVCDETGRVSAECRDCPPEPGEPSIECPECHGTGFVPMTEPDREEETP